MKRATMIAGAVGAVVVTTAAAPAVAAQGAKSAQQPAARPALVTARHMLDQADRELTSARRTAATVRQQAQSGAIDPEALAALQPQPAPDFRDGASEIELIAGLIGEAPPDATLAAASIDDLAALTPQKPAHPVPDTPLVVTEPAEAVQAAQARVAEATDEKESARALIEQLSGNGSDDGPGAAKLAELCSRAGVVVDICQPVRWNEAHLKFDTVVIGHTVNVLWDDVRQVGGYRPYDPYPDHPSGRAADIMMPHGGVGPDVELGNQIARYFQNHAKEYGIYYILWRQRMWKASDPVGAWTAMSDRGSPTANHMDHVHISVTTGHDGTAWHDLLREATKAAQA